MKKVFTVIFFIAAFSGFSQHQSKKALRFAPGWTNGIVVLETNDTIRCKLRYNQMVTEGLLQVKENAQVLTLSVRDVKSFLYFDRKKKKVRQYFTLALPVEASNRDREYFVEYIYGNARVSILNHRTIGVANEMLEFTPFRTPVPVSKKYLLDVQSGTLLPLTRENALKMAGSGSEPIKFVQQQGLKFKKTDDFIEFFEFCRRL